MLGLAGINVRLVLCYMQNFYEEIFNRCTPLKDYLGNLSTIVRKRQKAVFIFYDQPFLFHGLKVGAGAPCCYIQKAGDIDDPGITAQLNQFEYGKQVVCRTVCYLIFSEFFPDVSCCRLTHNNALR